MTEQSSATPQPERSPLTVFTSEHSGVLWLFGSRRQRLTVLMLTATQMCVSVSADLWSLIALLVHILMFLTSPALTGGPCWCKQLRVSWPPARSPVSAATRSSLCLTDGVLYHWSSTRASGEKTEEGFCSCCTANWSYWMLMRNRVKEANQSWRTLSWR